MLFDKKLSIKLIQGYLVSTVLGLSMLILPLDAKAMYIPDVLIAVMLVTFFCVCNYQFAWQAGQRNSARRENGERHYSKIAGFATAGCVLAVPVISARVYLIAGTKQLKNVMSALNMFTFTGRIVFSDNGYAVFALAGCAAVVLVTGAAYILGENGTVLYKELLYKKKK